MIDQTCEPKSSVRRRFDDQLGNRVRRGLSMFPLKQLLGHRGIHQRVGWDCVFGSSLFNDVFVSKKL